MRLVKNVFRPVVADEAGFRRYVASVTLFSLLVALTFDVPQQMIFFVNWADCLRDWGMTTVIVIAIAVPVARSMGNAHLALYHAKQEADRLGRTDPLTGLPNRRAFYEAAATLGSRALALVIADIDRFKRINDRYGHVAGDEVIKAVAERMREQLGEFGVVARVGGEEFALVSADRDASEVREALEQFRRRVADEAVPVGDRLLYVTVSVGFATRCNLDFDALYAAADKALYAAKSAGRDRVVNYDEIEAVAPLAAAKPDLEARPPDLAKAS